MAIDRDRVEVAQPSPEPPATAGTAGADWVQPVTDECLDDVALPPGGSDRQVAGQPTPAYVGSYGRDLRIDLLRGYFVLAMIIDHVRGPSPLYLLTGGNRFWTSAAEGFILTSGLVTGLVYRRLIERDSLGVSLLKLLKRAASLYLLTIGVTLLFLPISELLSLPWAQGVDLSNPLAVVVSILTLHRTYYLIDVMLLYTVLFVLVPLSFIFLEQGKVWPVLVGSGVLWALFQVFPEYAAMPWPIAGNYLFDFSAWQVLFFAGLILGYYHNRIPILDCRETRLALIVTGVATLILIGLYFIVDPPTAVMPAEIAIGSPVVHDIRLWLQENFFAKVSLRPGRLIASAITFSFLFLATTVFWRHARRFLGWLFLPLGQHALYAYTVHIAVTALVAIVLLPFHLDYPGPQWLNALIQIASVLLIWALVRWQFLAPTPKTQRLWYASPAVFAIVVLLALFWIPSPVQPGQTGSAGGSASAQARVPRRFGTPIAKSPTASSPVATTTPMPVTEIPTPTPDPRLSTAAALQERLNGYLGNIQGTLEEHWFYSPELDREMPYLIYLPPDYNLAGRRYPVLYMLHGRGGHRDEWVAYGLIDIADLEIRTGNLPPLLIVLPQGDKWYWTNHANDGPRWGEYLVRDLVPYIDATYRTLPSPYARAMGGLSMGGWGALHHAFTHPDIFGVVGAHSPSLRPDDGSLNFLGSGAEFTKKDPISLAQVQPGLNDLQIWLDTAQEDPWVDRATLLHYILAGRGIEHIWQLYPGGHDYAYWREHAVDYLHFYGQALTRK